MRAATLIRHTVMFRFRPSATGAEREALLAELSRFPDHFPEFLSFHLGENLSDRDLAFPHLFVSEFASLETLQRYLRSARHEAFVAGIWKATVEARAIGTVDCGEM
jgi:hypothetical protein